jgi:hypothetical protein
LGWDSFAAPTAAGMITIAVIDNLAAEPLNAS